MKLLSFNRAARARAGFTLAEVAVTLVVVGVSLVSVIQVLNIAKLETADTRNRKLANELARLTLGRVEAGLFQDEFASTEYLDGSFDEDGYPEFTWEILVGDEVFGDPDEQTDRFDSWAENEDEEEDDEENEEVYETVKVRVLSPPIRDYDNETILEQWILWAQVYGEEDEE